MSDSTEKNEEVSEETEKMSLSSFSTASEDKDEKEDSKGTGEKKTKRKRKTTKRKKKTTKKSKPEKKPDLIEDFIQEHKGLTLSRMIVLFSRKYNTPRLFESDIIFISPARDPRIILKYMYSKREK